MALTGRGQLIGEGAVNGLGEVPIKEVVVCTRVNKDLNTHQAYLKGDRRGKTITELWQSCFTKPDVVGSKGASLPGAHFTQGKKMSGVSRMVHSSSVTFWRETGK